MPEILTSVARRRFLLGGALVGAGALAASCTGNEPADGGGENPAVSNAGTDNDAPGETVIIGFSAPAADHGWIAAISRNAQAQAEQYSDIDFRAVEPTNDIQQQIAAVESLINDGVNAIVVLPNDGEQLNAVARQAMDAGIPVVNLDRIFPDPLSFRTYIGGDNYGMGVAAGHYIGRRLQEEGVENPIIAEVAGIETLPLTQQRSDGFRAALETYGFEVDISQGAQFTVESGQEVMSNILQARDEIHAVWNHDDDQGIGVLAAIEQAGRNEFFLVGGAGSSDMMAQIANPDSVVEATVTYNPSMASSAIRLARLIAQGRGMSDLVEHAVPQNIVLASETITADNVEEYQDLGFES
ncbi:substrate-binding domain-containing protein [Allonocardiopsis opalescens]|uniref:Monosaccharide ABC transporter substrate-binding protein (CUT2 family) n=1 Tax=Allonocardiopsis opalescens TaxID=1144618 RepID=A0A2T0Q0V4_9ACTN|nr:substrate-binding domain-containing protein [Allonocardiopsis opalescens]PRX97418.1 monosaccharide ABC transporter substrate-binding protein (CUT2 family) [Allonocardiopsis opalescens]